MVRKQVTLLLLVSSIGVWSLIGCGDESTTVDSQIPTDRPLLTFVWTPPETGTVDNYLVSISENEGPFVPVPEHVVQPRYSLSAEDGHSYRIQVQAFNEFSGGPPSDPSERVTVYQGQILLDP